MFPVRDDNPQINTPVATYAIIGLNVLAWVFLQGLGTEPTLSGSICKLGLIPGDVLQVFPEGTQVEGMCPLTGDGSWTTAVSSMFMHGGWMHIIGNMWFLYIFGDNVEDVMGSVRFVLFYVLSGLGAAGAQMFSNPESLVPMVGASGAIGGVMGAYIVLYPRVHVHMFVFFGFFMTTFAVPAVFMLGYWFLLQVFGGFGSLGVEGGGTAFWAHVGGFVAGAGLVFLFRDSELFDRHPYRGWSQQRQPTESWHRIGRVGGR